MAELALNPRALETLKTTAAARVGSAVAQRLSPLTVQRVQQLLQVSQFAGDLLDQGIGGVDQPLLGGVSFDHAREVYAQLRDAQLARKNLFFLRVVDYNPPPIEYADGQYFTSLFNLFAVDVSYTPQGLTGEKIPIGAVVLDRITGIEQCDLQVTAMDDSRGTLKRWFDGKIAQAARKDGTFGLPWESWVDIEVFHATPQADDRAYRYAARMRPQNSPHELSRRDQAMQEMTMTFTQTDTFLTP